MLFQTVYNYATITPFKPNNMKVISYKKKKIIGAKERSFYIFSFCIFACYLSKYNIGWFRVFGIGLKWSHEKWGLSFSRRNGHIKYARIGKYVFSYLR